MEQAGADIIDIGGESTRPGAAEVPVTEELARVLPIIEEIRRQSDVLISIDTSKPEVMRGAIEAGANIINDVRALREVNALSTAVELAVPVCLMHMQGLPRTMQLAPKYKNVIDEVYEFLNNRANECINAGMKKENIWLDPGFGFGKSLAHNLSLLKHLRHFTESGYPILVGMSRKSMIAGILSNDVDQRLAASLALATIATMNGASIIRAHDVKETVDIVKVCQAVKSAE